MTRSDYTHITLVVDRSGSMASIREDAEGGINTFIEEQKRQPGKCTFTLIEFDNQIDTVHENVDLQSVEAYTLVPRGSTALADAWGHAVNKTGAYLSSLDESERPGNVILVIVTDGAENASREFTTEKVKEMTEHQRSAYNWQVVFLAANQDAVAVGHSFGVPMASAMTYQPFGASVQSSYASASAAVSMTRSKGGPVTFTDEDRKKAQAPAK